MTEYKQNVGRVYRKSGSTKPTKVQQVATRLARLVRKHGGWTEDGDEDVIVRFPTPHQKDQFLKEWNAPDV